MLNNRNNREDGFALIASLMVLVLMFVLAMALVFKVNTAVKTSSNWQFGQQSFMAAEAGLQAAKRYIENQLNNNVSVANNTTAIGATGFDATNGSPLNGCLDYHPTRSGSKPGILKSLTVSGSAETTAPWTPLTLYHHFPTKINARTITQPEDCDDPENYYSLFCDMDLDNAAVRDAQLSGADNLNETYKNYGYSYFSIFLGNWENISKKRGEELTSSSNQKKKKDYFFKVVSCGIGPESRNTVETIFGVEK